jgi:hypothetical protein
MIISCASTYSVHISFYLSYDSFRDASISDSEASNGRISSESRTQGNMEGIGHSIMCGTNLKVFRVRTTRLGSNVPT